MMHDFTTRPLVIAHRGASGALPEQTLEAFDMAIERGADAIEFDVVATLDGKLLVRHESELSLTTNVAYRREFASKRKIKLVEGEPVQGWFAEEFTSAELRGLRARQRFPFRDRSFDDQFHLITLDAVLDWRNRQAKRTPLFIEVKHPTHLAGLGISMAELILQALASRTAEELEAIAIKCFEPGFLQELRASLKLPLVQLVDAATARPYDFARSADPRTYADLITPTGLAAIKQYADGLGVWKRLIIPATTPDLDGSSAAGLQLAPPTSLIEDAHASGLFISAWTFRDDPQFLAAEYEGDPRREYESFFALGIDGVITDFPRSAVEAREKTSGGHCPPH